MRKTEHDVEDHRTPQERLAHPDDARIEKGVNDGLMDDPKLDATEIQAHASEGQITLTGNVASHDDWQRAEDIARSVSGVHYVINNLRVQQHGTTGATG
jgi:osmotically-inducible protein OsmY